MNLANERQRLAAHFVVHASNILAQHTKAEKQHVVKTEMKKFSQGDLHSGSKQGPVVTNPKQATAIAMSESGQSKPAKHGYGRAEHHREHFKR